MRKLNVNINMSDTDMVSCNECKGTEFIQVHQIRRISPVISPSGEETFIPIQLFKCVGCGHINEEFLSN